MNSCQVRFEIDTGAQQNTVGQRYVRKKQVRPTTKNLIMWNKTKVKPVGESVIQVVNPKIKRVRSVNFVIVKNNSNGLLI